MHFKIKMEEFEPVLLLPGDLKVSEGVGFVLVRILARNLEKHAHAGQFGFEFLK